MNKKLKELLNKRKKVNKTLFNLDAAIRTIHIDTKVPCAKCGTKVRFVDMQLFRINWREIVAEYQFICDDCKYANRILFKSTETYRENMTMFQDKYLRGLVIKVIDIYHDENEPAKKYKFVNNFYVEDLISEEKEFEDA